MEKETKFQKKILKAFTALIKITDGDIIEARAIAHAAYKDIDAAISAEFRNEG